MINSALSLAFVYFEAALVGDLQGIRANLGAEAACMLVHMSNLPGGRRSGLIVFYEVFQVFVLVVLQFFHIVVIVFGSFSSCFVQYCFCFCPAAVGCSVGEVHSSDGWV